jgi:nucleotide-binding universal stress UspA family protein
MVALAFVSAGVLGLARSDLRTETARENALEATTTDSVPLNAYPGTTEAAPSLESGKAQDSTIGPTTGRAQRVSATLMVEVPDSDAVSRAAQEALDLTRSLGGHVVSASVATGEQGTASLTVRVPVARVQDAIAGLSSLGRIVAQQVTIEDLQEQLDTLGRREASLQAQIARISARLETEQLDAETQAMLEARRRTLQAELREIKAGIAATNAEARMSTIQLTVVTPGAYGVAAPPPSRLDRTIDEALNVLAWEGVIALGLLIVAAPFAIAGFAVWLGRRTYRRREEERLLAA